MPAISYYAQSLTELFAKRAHEQPDDPFIYTGVPEIDSAILLQSLTYVYRLLNALVGAAITLHSVQILPDTESHRPSCVALFGT